MIKVPFDNKKACCEEDLHFSILREEYIAIRSAALVMDSKLNNLYYASAAIFTALVAIYSSDKDKIGDIRLLLLTSIIYDLISLAMGHVVGLIIRLGEYEKEVLKPEIEKILNAKNGICNNVLGWQEFYEKPLNGEKKGAKFFFIFNTINGYLFPVMLGISPLLYCGYCILLGKYSPASDKQIDNLLMVIDIVLTLTMIFAISILPLHKCIYKNKFPHNYTNDLVRRSGKIIS